MLARIPSTLVAPAAGVLCAGILGNSLSAAWNGMEVPNPFVIDFEHALVAFNLADVWAFSGIFLLVLSIGIWLIRNRHAAPADGARCGRRAARRSCGCSTTPTLNRLQQVGQNIDEKSGSGTMTLMQMSVEPMFVPALASLDDLVPHDGLLSTDELEEVARGLAARD